jgi:hypothetical protein
VTKVRYVDLAGKQAVGIFWCPGPGPRTLWVLPRAGARSIDAVVVALPSSLNPRYRQRRYYPTSPVWFDQQYHAEPIAGQYWTPVVSRHQAQIRAQEARHAVALSAKDLATLADQEGAERAARLSWGERYTQQPYRTPDGPVWLHRKGQRCRWLDAEGYTVAECWNVAPAIAYAHAQDWRNELSDQLGVSPREELANHG